MTHKLRALRRRILRWLRAPVSDPAPYVALFVAISLTRMSGGPHDRHH